MHEKLIGDQLYAFDQDISVKNAYNNVLRRSAADNL